MRLMLKDLRILGSAPNSGYQFGEFAAWLAFLRLNISELVGISWKDMQRKNINNNIISVDANGLRHMQ